MGWQREISYPKSSAPTVLVSPHSYSSVTVLTKRRKAMWVSWKEGGMGWNINVLHDNFIPIFI